MTIYKIYYTIVKKVLDKFSNRMFTVKSLSKENLGFIPVATGTNSVNWLPPKTIFIK